MRRTALPSTRRRPPAFMTRRRFLALAGCSAAGLVSVALPKAGAEEKGAPPAETPAKPNFVFILSDDQGWNGTSVRMDDAVADSKSDYYRTPHLERLAKGGMRFSRAYAPSPVCSPTRYSLVTGKSTARHGMTKASPLVGAAPAYKLIPPSIPRQIARDETTLADLLKRAGYATAHFGKWHLGTGGPGGFGFDEHDGDTGNRDAAPHKDPNPVDIFGITRRAVAFMAKHAKAGKPFYAQLSHHALHYPENSRKATQQACAARPKGRAHHDVLRAAITEDLDAGVGELLDGVERLGLAGNTYVIYMSDNGGGGGSTNRPLTGGKGTLWEGGIRVPMIVRGPGVKAGSLCGAPVTGCDLLPTLCELAGAKGPLPAGVDGGSIATLLKGAGKGEVKRPREEIVWHFPHYQRQGLSPHSAILLGRYKLIEFHETNEASLFDLEKDIGERRDLAKELPDKAAELRRRLREYLHAVGTRMPKANPDYDPNASLPPDTRGGGKRGGKGEGKGGGKGGGKGPRD